ncbi:TPA: oxygenase MpaB family protein, partial [Klebsiella variicola subsp. variicola]
RFMASHLRYKRTVVSAERQEDYFRESAEIARRLGAQDIPQTPQEVADYLEAMRPQLRCDERTREVAEVLLSTRLPGRLSQPVGQVMMRAGIDLLPEWAQEMLGLSLTPLQRHTTRLLVHGVAHVLRASVRNGAWHCAMRRMQVE